MQKLTVQIVASSAGAVKYGHHPVVVILHYFTICAIILVKSVYFKKRKEPNELLAYHSDWANIRIHRL